MAHVEDRVWARANNAASSEQDLGRKLRARRKALELTVGDVASALGWKPSQVSKAELGGLRADPQARIVYDTWLQDQEKK